MKLINARQTCGPVFTRKILSVMVAGAFAGSLNPAFAEEDSHLAHVVVSASKIEQSTLEAPANVTVITSNDIDKTNNQRLGDAMNAKVPGLYLRGGALGNARPGVTMLSSMRGQGGTLTKLGVLVDGMNMVDAYSGQINWSMVSMDDVDNIEVVPGVGSSLYGSNAMGGLISITTKAPTHREFSYKAGIGSGDSSGHYEGISYRDKFENGLGLVFSHNQQVRDGYISEYVTKIPSGAPGAATVVGGAQSTTTVKGTPTYIVGDKGNNASKSQNTLIKAYFDLSPTAKIYAGFGLTENKSIDSQYNSYLYNSVTGSPLVLTNTAQNINIVGQRSTIKNTDFAGSVPMGNTTKRYFAGFDGTLGTGKLSVNIGKIDRDSWSSSIGRTATLTSGAGTLSSSPNSTTNLSAQYSWPIGNNHFMVAGIAREIATLHQKKYSTANWKDENSKTAELDRIDAKSTTDSIYIQDQISLTNKLTTYIGGRYDSWTAGGTGVVTTGTVPGTFVYADRKESAFSPKLAGVYQLDDKWSVKSSIGTGFRAPTNYYLFANPTFSGAAAPNGKMIYANPNLKPEKALAYDLGTEFHLPNGGQFQATYFITKTTDLIYQNTTKVPTYTDPIINKVIDFEARQENTGSALSRGIELSAYYPIISWLAVRGSYSYTDARITSDKTNTGMLGKRVTNVPKNTAYLAFEANKGAWSGVFSTRYVGEVYSNNDNSDVVKGVWTGYSKYYVSDLKVGYRYSKELKISLMVDNVFDKEYYEYYRMPGRGATLQLSGTF